MSLGLPLSDPLWAELYEGRVEPSEAELSEQEWTWLIQVAAIPPEGRDLSNFASPAVSFRLRSEEYWISLRRGPDFPEAPPTVKCSFRPGFFFDWGQNSSLSSLIAQFREYCAQLDETIALLKGVQDYGRFTLEGFTLDDEDADFMMITIHFQDIDDTEEDFSLRIDWRSPNEFPCELTSTNPHRFRALDCDQWNSEDLIGFNLAKLCGVPVDDPMTSYFCQMSSVPACVIAQPKDVSASSKALHSIPSKIEYTGPANIEGCFIQEKGEDGTLRAAFRGRGLEGCEMPLPEGYEVYVLNERLNSANTETRRFDIVDRATSFTFWEWDREAGSNSQPSRAFSLRVAQALADD